MSINLIIMILLAHCIGDYPLQGAFLAEQKGTNVLLLIVHSVIWAGVVYLALLVGGIAEPWKFVFLVSGHVLIDHWKCTRKKKNLALTRHLYIDQALHMVQLAIVVVL